ncbi:MAG: RnfABCDGE type electron transport complex subunit D [Clostridia bacterium]
MINKENLIVTVSPHLRSDDNTRSIMGDVIIALLPTLVMAVIFFSYRVLIVTAISVVSCVLFEYLYELLLKKPNTIGDLSAVVTGILLAFVLPPSVPYWIPVIGAFFAIVIVKQLFGGIGKNFVNPALAARAFLMSWPTIMTTFIAPFATGAIISSATPLVTLKGHAGVIPGQNLFQMFIGERGGSIGETSALFLLIGGAYLVIRKVINLRIPLIYISTVALLTFLFPMGYGRVYFMLANLLSGGLMLGAIFMATDYSTSPVTKYGQIFYAVGCGVLTVLFRYFGGYPEGVCYSILIMNCVSWLLDKIVPPERFGTIGGIFNVKKKQ